MISLISIKIIAKQEWGMKIISCIAGTSGMSSKLQLNEKSYSNEATILRGHALASENHAEINMGKNQRPNRSDSILYSQF